MCFMINSIRLADNGRKGKVVDMEMCNAMKEFLEGGRRSYGYA